MEQAVTENSGSVPSANQNNEDKGFRMKAREHLICQQRRGKLSQGRGGQETGD